MRGLGEMSTYSGKMWFVYNIAITTALAAGSSTQGNFQVDKDSDFFWTKLSIHALVGGTSTDYSTVQAPDVSLTITNTSSGRNYSNNAVPALNIAGTANLPFILPMETYLPAVSLINVQFANVGSVTYSAINLSFIGYKAFL